MLNRIIRFSIENKLIIALLTLGLIAWGIYSFRQLPIDAVPDITDNQVQVVTVSPSLAPQEVEQLITYPIEIAMANTQGVENIRSISRYGLSVVTIVFKENIKTLTARQLVAENLKIAEDEIPEGLGKPGMMPVTTGLGEIYQYTLDVDPAYESKYSATELRTIQDWIVKRQLAGIPGIVEVSSFGGFVKEYEVAINPNKLKNYDITINEVYQALTINNENTGGSYIVKGPNAFYVRTEGMLKKIEDIKNVVVKNFDGIPVLIENIAEVKIGHPPRFGAMTKDGKGEAVGGITLMLKGANASEVIKAVQKRVEEIQKSLPEGVTINPYLDRSVLVGKVMHTVSKNLIEGGLIVIFILVLLLGNFRAGIIIASIIPLSMLFAISMMNIFGVSANLMSLGAIDFGLIVDGSVIIVEGIIHQLYKKYPNMRVDKKSMNEVVLSSTQKIRKSASFGVIIILIVYLPILSLVGIEGRMFKPMALTVSFAILGAMLLSFTYVPMISSLFLSKNVKIKNTSDKRLMNFLNKLYKPSLFYALKNKALVVIAALLLFGGSVFLLSKMGAEFIPTLEEGDLAMQMTISPGSSLEQSVRFSSMAEKILLDNFPEVKSVVSKIGTAEIPTDPMAVEDADIMILLKPKKDWTTTNDREELVELMKEKLIPLTGAQFEFTQPIQLRFNELLTGTKSDVTIKVYGEDLSVLSEKGDEIAGLIQDVQGASDIKVERLEGFPQLVIRYHREKIAHLGLNIEDLNRTIRTSLAGEKAGIIFEGERKFDLVVRLDEEFRKDFEPFKDMYIETSLGIQVPISAVADVEFQEGPMQISRDNTQRRITVGINVRNRDIQSLVDEIEGILDQKLNLPPGYTIQYGGQFENLQAARDRGKYAVPVALIMILILLYFAFNSLKQSLLVFSAVPLSAIGGILALWIRGMPFSISAGVGFIALFGVAVLNGIVLINVFNQLKSEGVDNLRERVLEGASSRLRPVLMTAAVASLGFLPMAISSTAGAEVQRPLATVVIGGLITSTFLTLMVLPVLYCIFENRIRLFKPKSLAVLIFIGVSFSSLSQENTNDSLTIEAAIEIAIQNNQSIKAQEQYLEQIKSLKKTSYSLNELEVDLQRGQINSALIDNSWRFTQNIGNPMKMTAENKLYNNLISYQSTTIQHQQNQMAKLITETYLEYLLISEKIRLLTEFNNQLNEVEKQAKLKFDLGETNYLEYLNISTFVSESTENLKLLISQRENIIKNMDVLLGDGNYHNYKIYDPEFISPDQIKIPYLKPVYEDLLDQKKNISEQNIKNEKANAFPDISVGYFNQEIDHVGGLEGFEIGVSIPLVYNGHFNRVQATRHLAEAEKLEIEYDKKLYQQAIQNKANSIVAKREQLENYQNTLLAKAEEQMKAAATLYKEGEIGYFEYLYNIKDGIEYKINYLEIKYEFYQLVVEYYSMIK
jgi:cobalt-zinc-cadmium resistance protein CzcA